MREQNEYVYFGIGSGNKLYIEYSTNRISPGYILSTLQSYEFFKKPLLLIMFLLLKKVMIFPEAFLIQKKMIAVV